MFDYKKLIPNQELRLRILKLFDFVPDKLMIKLQYRIKTGRKLNLKDPKRFTEKLQWYKINYRNSLMTQCADKYAVREYVTSKGYKDILVPLYGAYDRVEDINFDDLPDKFVLKTTNGSKTNILCEDKSKLDIDETIKVLKAWLNDWKGKIGREWAYYDIKPKIICEEYLEKDASNDLIDYKFFCYNGEPQYLDVIVNRYLEGGLKMGIFNTEFEKLPYCRADIAALSVLPQKPKNFDAMLDISKKLSNDFPHVRVDLYNVNGEIFFGELTFYGGSGYQKFEPDEFDFIAGEYFTLPYEKKF